MHALDRFVIDDLRCSAYLRYVDDFALFSRSKRELYAWKRAIIDKLAELRLTLHPESAQVARTQHGVPWLGFVIYPTHRKLKRATRSTSRAASNAILTCIRRDRSALPNWMPQRAGLDQSCALCGYVGLTRSHFQHPPDSAAPTLILKKSTPPQAEIRKQRFRDQSSEHQRASA